MTSERRVCRGRKFKELQLTEPHVGIYRQPSTPHESTNKIEKEVKLSCCCSQQYSQAIIAGDIYESIVFLSVNIQFF